MKNPDLNLLLHFDALMGCRNVSRAAEQLGISQPAMSAAMNRLRQLFGDPLLVREGGAWQPTQRAHELHPVSYTHLICPYMNVRTNNGAAKTALSIGYCPYKPR